MAKVVLSSHSRFEYAGRHEGRGRASRRRIFNVDLPETLERRLDVTDFATPVSTVDTVTKGNNVRIVIAPTGEYDHVAYQTDNAYTVEIKPTAKEQQEEGRQKSSAIPASACH